MESITLYFKDGSSDKVYQVTLDDRFTGWVVEYAYGRRGTTLALGTKTGVPVPYERAKRIYDKLVTEKTAKGYTPGADCTPYTGTAGASDTGIRPQLLNPITMDEAKRLLADSDYFMQQKLDGRRLMLRKRGGTVTGINRRGLECGIPETIRRAALNVQEDFLLDGEAVGDTLHVFDLLEFQGDDLRERPYRKRLAALIYLMLSIEERAIECVITQLSSPLKCDFFKLLQQESAEGVVFKRASAAYRPGRPTSGGDQLKCKFVETASVVVTMINDGKRSAGISLWREGKLVSAGNVTIPPDHPIPELGQVAEIRYLYAMPESGSLYQPVYLGMRDDIDQEECQVDQLKYKAAA